MSKLAPTFSEVFDYKAYEEGAVGVSMSEDEKQGNDPSFDVYMDLNVDHPFYDVQNVPSHDEMTAAVGADMRGPLRILHRLFHGDEQENAPVPSVPALRRESTELVLDLPFPTAGPSRTASQQRLFWELERMTFTFGSEFDCSDAVFYGVSERGEGSSYGNIDEDEQYAAEDPCDSNVSMDCDDSEESLTDASQSEGEETVLDCESQASEDGDSDEIESGDEEFSSQPEEMYSCVELVEELPLDSLTPAPLEGSPSPPSPSFPSPSSFPSSCSFPTSSSSLPSSSVRRSSRVRRATQQFVSLSSPKKGKGKGKGKAVAAEPRPPASSRRTAPKRARSPSPDPESDSEDDFDIPSRSRPRKRLRRSHSEVQALLVPLEDGTTAVPCAVARCEKVLSRDNLHGLERHFRDHYSEAERKQGRRVQCRWGKCKHRHKVTELLRHLREDHLEARFACPDCGNSFSRIDPVGRHQRESCKGRPDAKAGKKGKGKRK